MNESRQLWPMKRVNTETGCAKSTIYQLLRSELFPRPVKIGLRGVRWNSDEVQEWIDSRPRA